MNERLAVTLSRAGMNVPRTLLNQILSSKIYSPQNNSP